MRGERNFLVDSSHLEPEKYLIPALEEIGMKPGDIDWLLCTHVHGDHIGGHHALHEKYGVKVADFTGGSLRNAIPFEACAKILVPSGENRAYPSPMPPAVTVFTVPSGSDLIFTPFV